MPSEQVLLALVALINAIGGVAALIIHALRVPYRESAAQEQFHAAESIARVRETAPGYTPAGGKIPPSTGGVSPTA